MTHTALGSARLGACEEERANRKDVFCVLLWASVGAYMLCLWSVCVSMCTGERGST